MDKQKLAADYIKEYRETVYMFVFCQDLTNLQG